MIIIVNFIITIVNFIIMTLNIIMKMVKFTNTIINFTTDHIVKFTVKPVILDRDDHFDCKPRVYYQTVCSEEKDI